MIRLFDDLLVTCELLIRRKQPEGLVAWAAEGTEMPFVEGKDVVGVVAQREYDVGSVGEPDGEVSVTLDNVLRPCHVTGQERLEPIRSAFDLAQERQLLSGGDFVASR